MHDLTPCQPYVECMVKSCPLSILTFSCQYRSTNAPYSFIRLLLTLLILAIKSIIKYHILKNPLNYTCWS